MAELLIDVLSGIFLITGGVFGVLGGIGLLRFPDFYTRLHAAGITDTLCAFLIIGGLLLQVGLSLFSLKLLLILLFMIFTSPTATHALARAGLAAGIVPFTREPNAGSTGESSSKP
ncbi:MAG: sodium:proton antiporter [Gammaproteobacteria bacterium HGW-Gammaproteobacteria-8]|nr:MAG: sodium:proton antiporter [Gammaproteobacteria bacterium HGW-Gammaproteobacteria-8]